MFGGAANGSLVAQEIPVSSPPVQQAKPPAPPQGPATRTIAVPGRSVPTLGTTSASPAPTEAKTAKLPEGPVAVLPTLGSTTLRTFDRPGGSSIAPVGLAVPHTLVDTEAVLLGIASPNPPMPAGPPGGAPPAADTLLNRIAIVGDGPAPDVIYSPSAAAALGRSPEASRRLASDSAYLPEHPQYSIGDFFRDRAQQGPTNDLVNALADFITQRNAANRDRRPPGPAPIANGGTDPTGAAAPGPASNATTGPGTQTTSHTRLTPEQLCLYEQALRARSCMECHGNPDILRAGIMPMDLPWGAPGAKAIRGGAQAAGEAGLGFVPVAGEAQDVAVLSDPASQWWEKCVSSISLAISGFTGTAAPNAGAFLRAGKRLDEIHDAVEGVDAAADAARATGAVADAAGDTTRAAGAAGDAGRPADVGPAGTVASGAEPHAPVSPPDPPKASAPDTPQPTPDPGAGNAANGSKPEGPDTPAIEAPSPESPLAWNDYSDLHQSNATISGTTTRGARKNADGSVSSVTPGELKKPLPNSQYSVNGYSYHTDAEGRVTRVEGTLDTLQPAPRNERQQSAVGKAGVERPEGYQYGLSDDGGHLIGSRFNGAGESINMVPQNSALNQNGLWKQMEDEWQKAIAEGKAVRVRIEPRYTDSSVRPDRFDIVFQVADGQPVTRHILNTSTGQ
jgi:hypothetical protein